MIPMSVLSIILEHVLFIIVVVICYISSSELMHHQHIYTVPWRRVLVDNVCHIVLGFISWLIVISVEDPHRRWPITSCILCGIFAGCVDIDHFIEARSIYLDDALNLPNRPFLHNTTLMLLSIPSLILIMHYTRQKKLEYISWILLVAVMSHHFRDALHRGLWLWPINLAPFNYFNCVIVSYIFPACMGYLMNFLYKPATFLDQTIV